MTEIITFNTRLEREKDFWNRELQELQEEKENCRSRMKHLTQKEDEIRDRVEQIELLLKDEKNNN